MRYRRLAESQTADSSPEQSKRQRVSTKLVLFLSAVVIVVLMTFPEWTERSWGILDPSVIKIPDEDYYGEPKEQEVGEGIGLVATGSPHTFNNESDIDDGEDSTVAASKRTRPICPRTSTQVVLLFPHVNKAGGRTVEGTFDSLTNPKPQFVPLTREKRSNKVDFVLVDGHKDYDEIREIVATSDFRGSCLRWIFMIREPMARTLSAFNTMVGRQELPNHRLANHFYCDSEKIQVLMKNPNFTFEEFAALPNNEIQTCQMNYHVRYLAGKSGNLERAKRRLARMSFVGIAEDFGLSMQLLSWELDLELELFTPVFNKNQYGKDETMSERAKKVLADLNTLDMELYNFAKREMFDVRIAAMRRFFGGKFPWNEPATCDKNVLCWDKRMRFSNGTWPFESEPPPEVSLVDPGSLKENVLCGPAAGCQLFRPEARKPVISKDLPPPLKVPSQSLCTASVFVVGARKGGTTSLYQYFSEHPNFKGILLDRGAQSGETFFFESRALAMDDDRALAPTKLRELYNTVYANEFRRQGLPEVLDSEYFLTGESSVGMGPSCYTPRVLKETCGAKVKVIYLIRNPVDRMLSQYQMRARLKRVEVEANFTADTRKQMRALTSHPEWKDVVQWVEKGEYMKGPPPCLFPNDFQNALWSGLYILHVARWYRQLDRSDVLIVQSETFFKSPRDVLVEALTFVGLDVSLMDVEAVTSKVFNAAPSDKSKEKEEEKEMFDELHAFFQPFNKALESWLSKMGTDLDLGLWKG